MRTEEDRGGEVDRATGRAGAPARRVTLPRLTDRQPLGGEGLEVGPVCLGMVGDPATIPVAFDAGVNFFFVSADMHWPLYEPTRRGLADLLARGGGIRDRIVVAGVCYPTQPEFCAAPFQELVDAVPGLSRLDVLLAGGAYAADFAVRAPIYAEHRRHAYVGSRAIGASFHDRRAALSAVSQREVDIAYVRYNPSHPGAAKDLFPDLPPRPRPLLFNFKSVFGYVPPLRMTEIGLPAPDYWHPAPADHYRFALTRPELDGALVGFRRPSEVEALADALARGPLTEEEETYLRDVATVDRGGGRVVQEGRATAVADGRP